MDINLLESIKAKCSFKRLNGKDKSEKRFTDINKPY